MKIDNVVFRMDAIETAAKGFFTTRVVKRSLLQHFDAHDPGEIEKGVIMIISTGESNYRNDLGMIAKEGTQSFLMICHLKLAEGASGRDIEIAEGTLIEEMKSFCRQGVAGMTIKPKRFTQSRQLTTPYGWVVGDMVAEPPNQNTH